MPGTIREDSSKLYWHVQALRYFQTVLSLFFLKKPDILESRKKENGQWKTHVHSELFHTLQA